MSSVQILVVDDAPQVRRVLRATLTAEGYIVFEARDGSEALQLFAAEPFDIILLDVNMPGLDGLQTCREIRRTSDVPIIMLTVRDAERDKVLALDAGADDYVVKPFGMQELLARIRASLRRPSLQDKPPEFVSKDLSIDFETRRVTKKLEPDPARPRFILTEPWVGYRFEAHERTALRKQTSN